MDEPGVTAASGPPSAEVLRQRPDVAAFLRLVESAAGRGQGSLFERSQGLAVARAPGRLDLMGGIADYSGALVLQWPLREAAFCAVQTVAEPVFRVRSLGPGNGVREFALKALGAGTPDMPMGYDEARALFARDPETAWAGYVLGNVIVLMHERGLRPSGGLRILLKSDVPEGKGVSSSAAVEVAVMAALARAFAIDLAPRDLALLCQQTENRLVGAACGVMDQMASACGQEGELMALLCRPAEILGYRRLPEDLEIWGIDSGERHAVSGSDYTSVRVGAFMGKRILEEALSRRLPYLAELTPADLEPGLLALPDRLSGSEFEKRYGSTGDSATTVESTRLYPVRAATLHPVREHARVRSFADLLAASTGARRDQALGELMYASHASYSACGLGSTGTDRLVALVREAGPERGFFGAKITGGGSGGTVAVLGRRGADPGPIVAAYARQVGYRPQVFSGSSPGAFAFGLL